MKDNSGQHFEDERLRSRARDAPRYMIPNPIVQIREMVLWERGECRYTVDDIVLMRFLFDSQFLK